MRAPSFADTSEHEDLLTGLADPFSPEAGSAQYPDQGAGRSLTYQQRTTFSVTTDANGCMVFAFNPKVSYNYLAQSSLAGSVVTWPANWSGNYMSDLVNSYGYSYRPTSFGIVISNILSATNCSGYLIIAKGGPPPLSSTTTLSPANFTSWNTYPLRQGAQWHATAHPRAANAYQFETLGLTQASSAAADDRWETVYIAIIGAPATTGAVVIDIYANMEYTVEEDGTIGALAKPQPVMSIPIQTAVNHVQSALDGDHHRLRETIKRETKKALVKHVIPFVAKSATKLFV